MQDKRTPAQREFDLAKHGWAFSNDEMLRGKIERCEEIAAKLIADDPRHKTLQAMKDCL